MLPAIVIRQQVKEKAVFSDELKVAAIETARGFKYSVSDRLGAEKGGRFYVSGSVNGQNITGLISVGAVNGQEVLNGGEPISKNPKISGGGPYVCLKLTPDPLKAEIECSPTFGVRGDTYLHPLALFKQTGKIAQFAYFDYRYKPFKKNGKWVHRITAA